MSAFKAIVGRGLPAAAAAGLLFSSASPLHPALQAFTSAGNALGGNEMEDTSHIAMPDEASVQAALDSTTGGAASSGFSLTKMFKNLFGPSQSDVAKAQLATIIENVKGRSQGNVPGQAPPPGKGSKTPAGKQPAGKTGTGKGTKGGQGTKGAKGQAGKQAAPAPTPTPAPTVEPAEPATDPGGEPVAE